MNLSRKILPRLYLLLLILTLTFSTRAQMEFIENKGQWDGRVNYRGNFSYGAFYLENNGFTVQMSNPDDLAKLSELMHGHGIGSQNPKPVVTVRSHAYKVEFLGSSSKVMAVPDKMLPNYNNYFIGQDRSKWADECRIYNAVTYANVYPNIDVRYYSDGNKLKYDFIVKPGGNVNAIAMRYQGADRLQVKNKELVISTSVGDVKELYPYSYQSSVAGKRNTVDCKYVVNGNIVRFKVGDYDPASTLVVDPSLIFSSFTGSTADNWGFTATPGPDGSFFMGGVCYGEGYPTSPGAYQATFGGGVTENGLFPYDIALMKLSPNGRNRMYATYVGGSGNEQPHSLMCDAQGNLVMAGRSFSTNYPVTTANTALGGYDIVITKFSSTGALIASTKIGGTNNDGVNIRHKYANPPGTDATRRNYGDDARSEVILDAAGNVYLASCSQSSDFPVTATAGQATFGGGRQDGVLLKLTPSLALTYSTFFGGGGDDAAFVLSINPVSGILYVAGGTTSSTIPGDKTGVYRSTFQGGECDGFITSIATTGGPFLKTTFMGTSGNDLVYGIQFDKFGFPYIMGTTTGNWPVVNATFSNPGSKQFISKLQPDLSNFVYSTVFGTAAAVPNLSPVAFLVDRCQNVYVSGWGGGLNITQLFQSAGTNGMPEVNPIPGLPAADGADFYFFVLERDANSQLFGTHFGQNGGVGDHVDGGTSRFDANGVIYQGICANCGRDVPFPTTAGVWAVNNGTIGCNQAAVKIEMNFSGVGASVKATIGGVVDTVGCVPLTIKFTDTLAKGKMYIWHYGDPTYPKPDTTYAPNNSSSHTYNQVGTYELMLVSIDSSTCNIADTAYISVKVGNNEVKPDFSFTKLDSCSSLRYRFDNLTTAVLPNYTNKTFIWDFGDGSPRIRTGFASQIHTYPSTGTYEVTLVVDDTTFCNSPDSIKKTLRISPNVKAQFEVNPIGCVPYKAEFKNTSIGGTDFIWEFGDTQTSTDPNPTHEYTAVGTYNVRLIAIDDNTCNKRDTSAYFTITVYPIPTANFSWAPNPAEENRPTRFTNLSVGATRYLWNFGDGETSTQVNPVHQYNSTGTFQATLYAYNVANCVDSITLDVQALIKPLLDVPNAFTPGRFTGSADVVRVMGFGIGQMSWKIYNRWGQVVFQTEDRNQGWDGKFKGALQPMDVYTYTLDVVFTDGVKFRKTGDITLLR